MASAVDGAASAACAIDWLYRFVMARTYFDWFFRAAIGVRRAMVNVGGIFAVGRRARIAQFVQHGVWQARERSAITIVARLVVGLMHFDFYY